MTPFRNFIEPFIAYMKSTEEPITVFMNLTELVTALMNSTGPIIAFMKSTEPFIAFMNLPSRPVFPLVMYIPFNLSPGP